MPAAKLTFHSVQQDTEDYGSFDQDDKHMVSVIYFTLAVEGRVYPDMRVEVRQVYGTDYESEPIDVARPVGPYQGPWNLVEFADHCARYYRNHLRALRSDFPSAGSEGMRMRNNLLVSNVAVHCDIPESGPEGLVA